MWGLLFFTILGIGCFINSCKNDYENSQDREKSRQQGYEFYTDNNGKWRRVSDNRHVIRTVRRFNGSHDADDVLIDVKTNEILHNYSEDKRREERQKTLETHNKNIEAKRKAQTEGRYYYHEESEIPIISGFYEELDRRKFSYNTTLHRKRRVSDDLLLDKNTDYRSARDARCEFYIWSQEAEQSGDIKKLRDLAARNQKKINRWGEDDISSWKENKSTFPSREEVESYARKIEAYLPDTIRNGDSLLKNVINKEVYDIFYANPLNNLDENNCNSMGFWIGHFDGKLIEAGYLLDRDDIRRILVEVNQKKKEGVI